MDYSRVAHYDMMQMRRAADVAMDAYASPTTGICLSISSCIIHSVNRFLARSLSLTCSLLTSSPHISVEIRIPVIATLNTSREFARKIYLLAASSSASSECFHAFRIIDKCSNIRYTPAHAIDIFADHILRSLRCRLPGAVSPAKTPAKTGDNFACTASAPIERAWI